MKKYLLLFLLAFSGLIVRAQFPYCNEALLPDQAYRGQTLTTTITNNQLYMGYGSAPCNPSDIRLYQGSSGTTIYASSLSVLNDSIYVGWNIPSNAPNGTYDLILDKYLYDPMFGTCIGGAGTCNITQAFGIETSKISGITYYDSNLDSIFNAGDIVLPYQQILLLPENVYTYSNINGSYQFFADTGAHTIVVNGGNYFDPYSSDSINLQVGQTNLPNQDFAFIQSTAAYNTDVNINGRARCNTVQTYTYFYNNHSLAPVDILFKIYYSGNVMLQNSITLPDSIVGDTLYYGLHNVTLANGAISVRFLIPSAGSAITFNAITITYDLSGNVISTNSNKLSQTVTCSYDPNDKTVNPIGDGPNNYTLFGDKLFYFIHFQNTGTDTAYDIHILDTIDANLDFSTFELVSSSHPVTVVATQNGIVDFRFYNIMLPDSFVNKPGSNGYVAYTIMAKAGLPEQTDIYNRAHIYFDSNAPVVTNQTHNSMVSNLNVGINYMTGRRDFLFYPNPFSDRITLVNLNEESFDCTLTIYDIQGRELQVNPITSKNPEVQTQGLSSGVYVFKLSGKDGSVIHFGKIIKQ